MNSTPRTLKFRLRRASATLLRLAFRLRATPYRPPGDGSALVIAPYPDDETFGCGGWIARQRAAGRDVHIIFVTDGSASHPSHPSLAPAEIKTLRATEARAAAAALQLDPAALHFLEIPDGQLSRLDPAVALTLSRRLHDLLRELSPSELLLPCRNDRSSEHEAAFHLIATALAELPASPRILEFPVWSWWSPSLAWRLLFSSAHIHRCRFPRQHAQKLAALACYRSQTALLPPQTHSALPEGFVALFSAPEEYFFEN